jgi:RNA polymerase sigma factor (sigma-70 family)
MDLDLLATQDLARSAREGDRAALDLLVRRTYPGVVRAARSLRGEHGGVRAHLETDDLAQSAYGDAMRVLPSFEERGAGSFRRWLLGILRNKVRRRLAFFRAGRRDARREAAVEAAGTVPSASPGPAETAIEAEDRRRLEDALNRLPERDRTIIVCRYHLDLPWKEVGARIGMGEEAAQMACRRALAKARRLIDEKP